LLVVFAALRLQAPLVAVSVTGFPLLFGLYMREFTVDDDAASLVLTTILGVGLGVGWALVTGDIVALSQDVALSDGTSTGRSVIDGLIIPAGAAVLMLLPALVVRRRASRKPLAGYRIGALSAVAFTAAAMLTRLAPQLTTGATAGDRPINGLLVEAGIEGIALPLTAASVGGLFGVALSSTRVASSRRTGVILLLSGIAVAIGAFTALGLIEVAPIPQILHFVLHIAVAVIAMVALRIGIHTALLHDASATDVPVRHTTFRGVFTVMGAGMVVAVAAAVTAAVITTPVAARYVCPPDCGRPPIGKPVETNPWFTSSDGRFSVQYPRAGTAYEVTLNPDGVEVNFTAGDTGTMEFFGLPANRRTPKQIGEDLVDRYYPDAATDYEIPNAMVGYQPGYGVVKDEYPQDASGTFSRLRIVVMVAVKDDYALVAAAIGPYHQFSPEFGSGHPSGVNLQLALDMGKYVNSFTWRQPPR
jgi:hypothetical protein